VVVVVVVVVVAASFNTKMLVKIWKIIQQKLTGQTISS
jgi:hypothetical protein